MSSSFNSGLMTPVEIVYPFKPLIKLNIVARSLTRIFFGLESVSKSPQKNKRNYNPLAQRRDMDTVINHLMSHTPDLQAS